MTVIDYDYIPWVSLALLGVYHGLNPGMGWLFAVALGLQERSRAAVIRAFGPIAAGHAASVAIVIGLVSVAEVWIDPDVLLVIGAGALVSVGLYKLLAPLSHPRWVGMRVTSRDLTVWSFLMATAHGAGLMLVPVLLHQSAASTAHAAHAGHDDHALMMTSASGLSVSEMAALGVHTGAMYVAMAAVAIVVFEKAGLAILRRAWFNLDRVWAVALIAGGALTLAM
jgi:hypothetical protein